MSEPVKVFDQIFSGFNGGDPALAAIRSRRASVLDAVAGQLALVQKQVGGEDRKRIDQHVSLVRDLENRLGAVTNGAACAKPDRPPVLAPESETTMQQIADLQIDLMVMAFACDLTRVGLLQFSSAENHIFFPWLNSFEDGHNLSHLGNDDPERPQIGDRDLWYAQRFAQLLSRLQQIPEGGGTMLDNTLVFWVNELSVGNVHSQKSIPFILAGHAAGFRMGRYLQYSGVSHTNLLLSVLHAMGVDDATFGNPDFLTGELSGLF
jgi:hypothetical protein